MFNRAALNPSEFIAQRDLAYTTLKTNVNKLFNAYTDSAATDYATYGKLLEGLPKSERINYAKAACMNYYALEKKKLELIFPETFTTKAQERILKGTTQIDSKDASFAKLLKDSKEFDKTLGITPTVP
jgi:hypothetical protein